MFTYTDSCTEGKGKGKDWRSQKASQVPSWNRCVHVDACVSVYMRVYTCGCVCAHVDACVRMWMRVCTCGCMCAHVDACVQIGRAHV